MSACSKRAESAESPAIAAIPAHEGNGADSARPPPQPRNRRRLQPGQEDLGLGRHLWPRLVGLWEANVAFMLSGFSVRTPAQFLLRRCGYYVRLNRFHLANLLSQLTNFSLHPGRDCSHEEKAHR